MPTLDEAIKFARGDDAPHAHADTRKRIVALAYEILAVHKAHMYRPAGNCCAVCGARDLPQWRTTTVLRGYEGRTEDAPRLCAKHANGWAAGLVRSGLAVRGTPAEHIDLHFVRYLANHLMKVAK